MSPHPRRVLPAGTWVPGTLCGVTNIFVDPECRQPARPVLGRPRIPGPVRRRADRPRRLGTSPCRPTEHLTARRLEVGPHLGCRRSTHANQRGFDKDGGVRRWHCARGFGAVALVMLPFVLDEPTRFVEGSILRHLEENHIRGAASLGGIATELAHPLPAWVSLLLVCFVAVFPIRTPASEGEATTPTVLLSVGTFVSVQRAGAFISHSGGLRTCMDSDRG